MSADFVLTLAAPKEHGLETFDTDASIWSATDTGKIFISRYTGDSIRDSVMKIQGPSWTLGDGRTLGDGMYLDDSLTGMSEGAYKDFTVTAGIRYAFSCLHKMSSGTLTIQLHDQTNNASISSVNKTDTIWKSYEASIVAPAGCSVIRVKLLQSESDVRPGPFYVDNISLSGNVLLHDPDSYSRVPERVGSLHQTLGGRRVYDLRAIHYSLYLGWNFFGEDQYENLREIYYSNELLYFDDGDVPPLIESERIYETAQYDYVSVANPSSIHKAHSDSSSLLPSSKSDFETTEYTTAEYQAIDADDDNYKETTNPAADEYLYHKFLLLSSISIDNVMRFRVKVAMSSNDSSPQNLDGGVLFAWNGANWVELARNTNSAQTDLTYSTAEAEVAKQFVDSDDNYIRLLLRSRNRRHGTYDLSLRTYYVECEINEGLDSTVQLTHKAILDDEEDVIWVKNVTQGTTLEKGIGYTISTDRREVNITGAYAHLDGGNQYFYRSDADFPESGITGANDFTIQAWIRPDSLSGGHAIASKFATTGNKRMFIFYQVDAEMRLYVSSDGTSGTTYSRSSTNAAMQTGRWIHVAVVYDASAGGCTFYRDGLALADNGDPLPNSIADKDPDFTIGAWSSGEYFDGGIRNVCLFDDKRTPTEILASATNLNEDCSSAGNIIGQWMFNDAANASYIDNTQGDAGRDLIPYNGGDTTFGNCGREAWVDVDAEVEIKYNRYFEVMFASIPEEWFSGDPSSGDRSRSAEIVLETLSESK